MEEEAQELEALSSSVDEQVRQLAADRAAPRTPCPYRRYAGSLKAWLVKLEEATQALLNASCKKPPPQHLSS